MGYDKKMHQRLIGDKTWHIVGGYHVYKKYALEDLRKAKRKFHHAHIRKVADGYEVVARQRRKRR